MTATVIRCVREGGTIFLYGALSGVTATVDVVELVYGACPILPQLPQSPSLICLSPEMEDAMPCMSKCLQMECLDGSRIGCGMTWLGVDETLNVGLKIVGRRAMCQISICLCIGARGWLANGLAGWMFGTVWVSEGKFAACNRHSHACFADGLSACCVTGLHPVG